MTFTEKKTSLQRLRVEEGSLIEIEGVIHHSLDGTVGVLKELTSSPICQSISFPTLTTRPSVDDMVVTVHPATSPYSKVTIIDGDVEIAEITCPQCKEIIVHLRKIAWTNNIQHDLYVGNAKIASAIPRKE